MGRKKTKEQYVPLTGLMGNATDYHVYNMGFSDRIKAFAIGFGLAFGIGYVFFRALSFCLVMGVLAGMIAQKPYCKSRRQKRKDALLIQFKDMLEDLTTAYSAGENTLGAFSSCVSSMTNLYGEKSDIARELQIIVGGMANGLNIEELLMDFSRRADLDDVQSFAEVFEVANRQGGNIKRIISDTRNVINDKIEIEMEIQSLLNSSKNDINIMIVMPVIIVLTMGVDDSMSITSNSGINVIVKIVCLGIFTAAYLLGRKMTNIKV